MYFPCRLLDRFRIEHLEALAADTSSSSRQLPVLPPKASTDHHHSLDTGEVADPSHREDGRSSKRPRFPIFTRSALSSQLPFVPPASALLTPAHLQFTLGQFAPDLLGAAKERPRGSAQADPARGHVSPSAGSPARDSITNHVASVAERACSGDGINDSTPMERVADELGFSGPVRALLFEEFDTVKQLRGTVKLIPGTVPMKSQGMRETFKFKLGVASALVDFLSRHQLLD